MQISPFSRGMSPLNTTPPPAEHGQNASEIQARLNIEGPQGSASIPVSLSFGNNNQSPSPLDFSPLNHLSSLQNNPLLNQQPSNLLANNGLQSDNNNQGGLLGQIQQLLQEFMQQLLQMLSMSRGDNNDSSTPAASGGTASGNSPASTAGAAGNSGNAPTSPTGVAGNSGNVPASTTATAGNSGDASFQPGDTSLKTSDPALQKLVDRFGGEYSAAAKETGVPAKLLAAVTMQESGGDVAATSTNPGNGKTDSGMNQINPDTYAGMRAAHPDKLGSDINDPKNQIMCTALMLKEGKEKFGSYDAALRAYNSGDNQVDLHDLSHVTLGDPNYVKEVNSWAAKFN